MAITLTIAGSARSFSARSLRISDRIEERSVADFVVVDVGNSLTFSDGDSVTIVQDGTTIFGGFVDRIRERIHPGSNTKFHAISCKDWHYLADKRIAAESYADTAAGTIVTDLVTNYLSAEGVSAGTISTGPVIGSAIINYASVSEAMDALAEKSDFTWYIKPDRTLNFHARGTAAAPWNVAAADILVDSVELERGNPQYRNRQFVRGGISKTDTQTENQKGDGLKRAFAVGFPIAQVPTITVNGVSKTVGIKGIDTGKDWYWNKGDAIVTQDEGGTLLTSSNTLTVSYIGEFRIIALAENPAAIAARKARETIGTGRVEDILDEPNAQKREDSHEVAKAKLSKYAVDGDKLSFRTSRSGLLAGQVTSVTLSGLGLSAQEMLVESVSISDDGKRLWYDVAAVDGPVSGSWAKLFGDMFKATKGFVDFLSVGSGDVLAILAQFSENTGLSESIVQTTVTCATLPATLSFTLC